MLGPMHWFSAGRGILDGGEGTPFAAGDGKCGADLFRIRLGWRQRKGNWDHHSARAMGGMKERRPVRSPVLRNNLQRKRLLRESRRLSGSARSGIGAAMNSRRTNFAIHRARRADLATRALSVAMPVFAYIWR